MEVHISNDPFVRPGFLVVGTHARVNVAEETADMRRIRTAHYGRQRSIKATGNITCSFYAIAEGHFEEQNHLPTFVKSQLTLIKHDYATSYRIRS